MNLFLGALEKCWGRRSLEQWWGTPSICIFIMFRNIIYVSLQITQISCLDPNKAPSGCTQYFYGSTTGTITSFNYANSVQLANQRQTICIRYFNNLNNENKIELVLQMHPQHNFFCGKFPIICFKIKNGILCFAVTNISW